ncbi:MAG: Hvo_1808 family surface protein [Halobacteriaceae archaeon]
MTRRRAAGALLAVAALLVAGCVAPTGSVTPGGLGGKNAPPDPSHDVLGWEQGYWYNESLAVTTDDGLNETELHAVVHRAMARVERLRGLEYDRDVPVTVLSRKEYRQQVLGGDGGGDGGSERSTRAMFTDAKYEALFLVGEGGSSTAAQKENQATNVQGYYAPSSDRIVVISDSDTPALSERTLAHELLHAVQFRTFDVNFDVNTSDGHRGASGLIEGDARYLDQRYGERCGAAWSCVSPPNRSGSGDGGSGDGQQGGGVNQGLAILNYFPYSDGPGFVAHFRKRGGWDRVNRLYDDPPATAEQVAVPSKYGSDPPVSVPLSDTSGPDWQVLGGYDRVGIAGIAAMFAYPSYGQGGGVVPPQSFLNVGPDGKLNDTDPIDYTFSYTDGWAGDKFVAYRNPSGEAGQYGYVWRLRWDDAAQAREFADGYRTLLRYYGAESVDAGGPGVVWRISDGKFADAFRVTVSGDTVTVVNAPTVEGLDAVHRRTGE